MNENLRIKSLVGVAILAGCCAVWGQPRYTAVEIPTLGGVGSIAQGINNAGQIVGQAAPPGNTGHRAFFYKQGTMYDLWPAYAGVAWAVNNSGCAAGFAWLDIDQGTLRAVRFSRDGATELGTLGGRNSQAFAINNSGDIVGISTLAGDGVGRAFLYRSGQMIDLGTLGGTHSLAYAINDRGDIAGMADLAGGGSHVFLYRNGQMEDLGFPGVPYAMNNRSQVVGGGYLPQSPGKFGGFVYDCGRVVDLGSLGAEGTIAYGINNSGTIVGSSSPQTGVLHAFVIVGGQMYDLNGLLVNEILGTLIGAQGVNDRGEIIAVAEIGGVIGWSYLLTPVHAGGSGVGE